MRQINRCIYSDLGWFQGMEGRSAQPRITQERLDATPETTSSPAGDETARVERGFLHLHSKLSQGHVNLRDLATTVLALADLLVAQGFVSIDELRAQSARARWRST